jgi:thymidylate synthase (FAD)
MNTAKLIAITKPLIVKTKSTFSQYEPDEMLSVKDFVAYVARVSNPDNQNNHLTADRLLKYLAKNKHWSPFEMVNMVFEINTTRDIARQILRHRSFSFQEFSQRYANPTNDLGFTARETRLQDTKNRQNSIEIPSDWELNEEWHSMQQEIINKAKECYNWAIQQGIAKEQARAVLPEGLTMSRMYMNGTLRSYIHYCQLRMSDGTQKEHREIAKDIWTQVIHQFPDLEVLNFDKE